MIPAPLTGPTAITDRVGTMKRKVKRVQVGHTSNINLTSVIVILPWCTGTE